MEIALVRIAVAVTARDGMPPAPINLHAQQSLPKVASVPRGRPVPRNLAAMLRGLAGHHRKLASVTMSSSMNHDVAHTSQ
ncbi:MAG: hypothetical protein C0478_04910 [Planctomyces sp.]|nr:hypothetical protein [Planctomyces sp.]